MLIPKSYFGTDNQGGHPPQGIFEARRVREVFFICYRSAAGASLRGGGVHLYGSERHTLFIMEYRVRTLIDAISSKP